MQKSSFLKLVDQILDVPEGTVRGTEALSELKGWDSLSAVEFISIVNEQFGVTLSAKDVQSVKTLPALLSLIPAEHLHS